MPSCFGGHTLYFIEPDGRCGLPVHHPVRRTNPAASRGPVTAFDQRVTGITAQMLATARPAAQVLAALEQHLAVSPCRLVAHHAPSGAGLLDRHRQHCPALAATALVDTVRMARAVIPHLPSHRLDEVLRH